MDLSHAALSYASDHPRIHRCDRLDASKLERLALREPWGTDRTAGAYWTVVGASRSNPAIPFHAVTCRYMPLHCGGRLAVEPRLLNPFDINTHSSSCDFC